MEELRSLRHSDSLRNSKILLLSEPQLQNCKMGVTLFFLPAQRSPGGGQGRTRDQLPSSDPYFTHEESCGREGGLQAQESLAIGGCSGAGGLPSEEKAHQASETGVTDQNMLWKSHILNGTRL